LVTTTPIYFGIFFFLTPLLAGATGGLGRNLLDFYREEREQPGHTPIVAIVLGAIAGTVAAILFVSAQWASNPEIRNLDQSISPGLRLLVLFEFVIGLLSGFTLDALFRQWEKERPKLGNESG
jgi:H+/Cl- antiporter ClcA